MQGVTKFWASLGIALAAVLLGLAYLRTRSLALPIGIHLGWNWFQGNILGFGVSGNSQRGWVQPLFHGKAQWVSCVVKEKLSGTGSLFCPRLPRNDLI